MLPRNRKEKAKRVHSPENILFLENLLLQLYLLTVIKRRYWRLLQQILNKHRQTENFTISTFTHILKWVYV